ncbi:MAG: DUF5025 domain-containing protein [Chitinophagaceae bacterium]|nr:DUF5025 domain-containing protein [Chitinophagaceae bacterium]
MKKIFSLSALVAAVITILIVAGCKKDNNNNNNNNGGGSGISGTFGGKAWQSTYVIGDFSYSTLALNGYYVNGIDTTLVYIGILTSIKVGQPDVNFQSSDVGFTKANGTIANGTNYTSGDFFGGHGTLTVTSWDTAGKKINGTFSGVLYNPQNSKDSMVVTNGHFNTSYTLR